MEITEQLATGFFNANTEALCASAAVLQFFQVLAAYHLCRKSRKGFDGVRVESFSASLLLVWIWSSRHCGFSFRFFEAGGRRNVKDACSRRRPPALLTPNQGCVGIYVLGFHDGTPSPQGMLDEDARYAVQGGSHLPCWGLAKHPQQFFKEPAPHAPASFVSDYHTCFHALSASSSSSATMISVHSCVSALETLTLRKSSGSSPTTRSWASRRRWRSPASTSTDYQDLKLGNSEFRHFLCRISVDTVDSSIASGKGTPHEATCQATGASKKTQEAEAGDAKLAGRGLPGNVQGRGQEARGSTHEIQGIGAT